MTACHTPAPFRRLYALDHPAAPTHHPIIPCGRNTRPTHDPAPLPGAEGSGAWLRIASPWLMFLDQGVFEQEGFDLGVRDDEV